MRFWGPRSGRLRQAVLACFFIWNLHATESLQPRDSENYKKLRNAVPSEYFNAENIEIRKEGALIRLKQGTIGILPPVEGKVWGAVFVGGGVFEFTPPTQEEKEYLKRVNKQDSIVEPFQSVVLVFTDDSYRDFQRDLRRTAASTSGAQALIKLRAKLRERVEYPRSFMESVMNGESMENLEAEVLASIENPKRPGFFFAFMQGEKHGDLRFLVRPTGAVPSLPSPEEVAILNLDLGDKSEAIWYMGHLEKERLAGAASALEDKRIIDVERYTMDVRLAKGTRLEARAVMRFQPSVDGERIVHFDLLPNLRVLKVGGSLHGTGFLQEDRNSDGGFYAFFSEPLQKGKTYELEVEYAGDKVIEAAGSGMFSVGARTSWYPSLGGFTDRSTFDLTFRVPKGLKVASIGKLEKEWTEDKLDCSRWVSPDAVPVAGFNYGLFKSQSTTDPATAYVVEGHSINDLPDYLHGSERLALSATTMMQSAVAQAQNAIRVYTYWFGASPYGRLALTQQPEFNFGQSWPNLIYLPFSAFLDSTQRYLLMSGINQKLTSFVDEVTAHEVAHQWWGHLVMWASYRDQWLSEGAAMFSTGLYLQATEKDPEKYRKYWEEQRKVLLEKNAYGLSPNDTGPVHQGLRLITERSPRGYSGVVYSKGGYVLHMLRTLMWDKQTGDANFRKMMQEFVASHLHKSASTESFQAVVEKHMSPGMDLEKNGKMDWFFRQWVLGTDVPKYDFQYQLADLPEGKCQLTAVATQSMVSDNFYGSPVVYIDFDGKPMRLGTLRIKGNARLDNISVVLPKRPKRVLLNANFDVLSRP